MKFTFTPLTDEQIETASLLPEGLYNFEVANATVRQSKAGNNMIELNLIIYGGDGEKHYINDYLVALDSMMFKVKHFCEAVGLGEKYEKGEFTADDCLNKAGQLKITIRKDKNGTYPPKNSVHDYVKNANISSGSFNDDIPF